MSQMDSHDFSMGLYLIKNTKEMSYVCVSGFGVTSRKMSDYVFINTETFLSLIITNVHTEQERHTISSVTRLKWLKNSINHVTEPLQMTRGTWVIKRREAFGLSLITNHQNVFDHMVGLSLILTKKPLNHYVFLSN